MMMTTEELEKKLNGIDTVLYLLVICEQPSGIYFGRTVSPKTKLYDFDTQKYDEENCLNFIPDKIHDLNELLDDYYEGRNEILARDSVNLTDRDNLKFCNNPFKKYTDHLAETLLEKNKAYGDSFTKSVDKYGLPVIGVRLSDKYNRIEHLITNHELKENDESLEDTLLDMAGYSILGLKYLEEHEK